MLLHFGLARGTPVRSLQLLAEILRGKNTVVERRRNVAKLGGHIDFVSFDSRPTIEERYRRTFVFLRVRVRRLRDRFASRALQPDGRDLVLHFKRCFPDVEAVTASA